MLRQSPPEVRDRERLRALDRTGLLDSGPEASFDRLASLAQRLIDAPVALVSLVDRDRQYFKSCIGLAEPYAALRQTPLTHSICQYTLSSPEPLIVPDARKDPRLAGTEAVTELSAVAYLGIPLVDTTGHILGSFCVIDHTHREWTASEVAIMADLAGAVMGEIALHEALHERDRLAAVVESTTDMVILTDDQGTVTSMNPAAAAVLGTGGDDMVGASLQSLLTGPGGPDDPFGVASWLDAAAADGAWQSEIELLGRSGEPIPVSVVLLAHRPEKGRAAYFSLIARDATSDKAAARDAQRLANLEQDRRARAERLLHLAEALTAAVDVDDIEHVVAEHASAVVGAAFSNIAVADRGRNELMLNHGSLLSEAVGSRWLRIPLDDATPLGRAIRSGKSLHLRSPEQIVAEFPAGAADAAAAGFEAMAAVPLARTDAAIGFAWTQPQPEWEVMAADIGTVAELCSQALQRAQRFDRERQIAERLQQSLLPLELVKIPGAQVAARYEAGASDLHVGGDWYDVGQLDEDRFVLAVGDVVGHGLQAASTMGEIRHAFSALLATVEDLSLLVQQLDQFALEIEDARLTTMICASFDATSGAVALVSAGHPPGLIRRADGTITEVGSGDPPLGFAADTERRVHHDVIEVGDALVLYTDGLIERPGESIDVGLARLRAALADHVPTSPEELCEALYTQVGSEHDDDVAVLALLR